MVQTRQGRTRGLRKELGKMTGRDLIEWIKANHAERLQIVVIDDGYAIFPARPEVRENEDLKRVYVNSAGLKKGEKSVVM